MRPPIPVRPTTPAHPPIPAKDLRPAPPDRAARTGAALVVTLLGSTALATPGDACMIEPDASASVSIEIAPGVEDEIQVLLYESRDEHGRLVGSECYANVMVELSAFPSISNRLDTYGVARAIRESAFAIGAQTCDVSVLYEDPRDELELGEECVTATFGFSSSDYWTSESERSCWSPEEVAQMEAWEREREAREARDAAEADAFAAAEDGIDEAFELDDWGESLDEEAARAASEAFSRANADPEAAEDDLLWAGN